MLHCSNHAFFFLLLAAFPNKNICFAAMPLCSKVFLQIGRFYCTYKSFRESLRYRQDLDSQVMEVWIEKFNQESKVLYSKYPRLKKKFAFSVFMTVSNKIHNTCIFYQSICFSTSH
jgi:hypothetical protein